MPDTRERSEPIEDIAHRISIGSSDTDSRHDKRTPGEEWQLGEHEYSLIVAYNAFNRWITRCMAAVGYPDFSPLDILVLHNVNHRKRPKRLADICFALNVEDQHTVNYALKKMLKFGLIEGERRGKERFYKTTLRGESVCRSYLDIRAQCQSDAAGQPDRNREEFQYLSTALKELSGFYDQAARAASSV